MRDLWSVRGLPAVAALVGAVALGTVTFTVGSGDSADRQRQLGPRSTDAWRALCAGRPSSTKRIFVSRAPLKSVVAASRAGMTFCIRAGVHRLSAAVVPRTGQSFIGEPGAVLSGAKDITSRFVPSGRYWAASGRSQQNPAAGKCRGAGTVCTYPNDVFFDGRPLRRVLALSALGPGRFFFDREARRIWIGRSPTGHRVEVAVTTRAFEGWYTGAVSVAIRGLVIEKFANEGQTGAVRAGSGWLIDGNEIRLNHGVGLQGGDVVTRNLIHHNGQLGFSTHGSTGTLFAYNEVAHNNYAGYDWFWEAGGAKFMVTTRLTVRGNYVHHNRGAGLATDWDTLDTVYEGNRVEDNLGVGIFHEASYDALIRNNLVRRNGFANPGLFDGAGIGVHTSQNVEIVGNTIVDNLHGVGIVTSDREDGKYGVHATRNVFVHDNTIALRTTTGTSGLASGDPADYTTNGNRFLGNRYTYCQSMAFAWQNPAGQGYGFLTRDQWTTAGNDTTGSFRIRAEC